MSTDAPKPGLLSRLFGGGKPADTVSAAAEAAPKLSWWQRLKGGLARSSTSIGQGITDLFTKKKLDAETLEDFEDVLIRADLGLTVSARIVEAIGKGRYGKELEDSEVKAILAGEIEKVLTPVAKPLVVDAAQRPFVILMVGVNGSGKKRAVS